MRIHFWLLMLSLFLTGCSQHKPLPERKLPDPIVVVADLSEQLRQWKSTPYRYGGLDQRGVDCSGFVYRTFSDKFAVQLPRTTLQQTQQGEPVSRDELLPGDLVFFKTGRGKEGLHVGIYHTDNQFIHASTTYGVTLSSLDNVYWRRVYWQARRL